MRFVGQGAEQQRCLRV